MSSASKLPVLEYAEDDNPECHHALQYWAVKNEEVCKNVTKLINSH